MAVPSEIYFSGGTASLICTVNNQVHLVGRAGLEPARAIAHQILSLARLPIPPPAQQMNMIMSVARLSTLTSTIVMSNTYQLLYTK